MPRTKVLFKEGARRFFKMNTSELLTEDSRYRCHSARILAFSANLRSMHSNDYRVWSIDFRRIASYMTDTSSSWMSILNSDTCSVFSSTGNPTVNYLPHHTVKEASTFMKRVVFDASSPTISGKSLNDCLLVGPTI